MFHIVVWHTDAVNGTHQSVIASRRTARGALVAWGAYLAKYPQEHRSFTAKALVQLHGPFGRVSDLQGHRA